MNQINQPMEPKRNAQVQAQLSQSMMAMDKLSSVIGELGNRLSAVLRDSDPQGTEAIEDVACLVPVASEIRSIKDGIDVQVARIKDYLHRLEV